MIRSNLVAENQFNVTYEKGGKKETCSKSEWNLIKAKERLFFKYRVPEQDLDNLITVAQIAAAS